MTTILVYLVILTAAHAAASARTCTASTRRERIGRVEGVIYRLIGVDPMVGADLAALRGLHALVQRDRHGAPLRR